MGSKLRCSFAWEFFSNLASKACTADAGVLRREPNPDHEQAPSKRGGNRADPPSYSPQLQVMEMRLIIPISKGLTSMAGVLFNHR